MPGDPDSETNTPMSESVDLSGLEGLNFGPDWSDSTPSLPKERTRERDFSKTRSGEQRKDRRPDRRKRGSGPPAKRTFERERFVPQFDVNFYPEDEPFKALINAIRTSARTYELFEIAQLILGKRERFVVVVKANKDAKEKTVFLSVPDGLPFESEESAVNHVINTHIENFFECEEVEIDPPKGNFPTVNRCTITGKLLAPPNYHRYQEIVQAHFKSNIHNISFERFSSKIEAVKDPEVISEWSTSMTKTIKYTLKSELCEGEPPVFTNNQDTRRYLLRECKKKIVQPCETARFPGKLISLLPDGNLKRSIEREFDLQKRFPLNTANHLRSRLRRLRFSIYKKGSKGVSFVCSVKRRFRTAETILSDRLNDLIGFIESNPYIQAGQLPEKFLKISKDQPDPKNEEQLKQLNLDLRWLVTEGYVTEFGDGRLFTPPISTNPDSDKKKSKAKTISIEQKEPTSPVDTPPQAPADSESKESESPSENEAEAISKSAQPEDHSSENTQEIAENTQIAEPPSETISTESDAPTSAPEDSAVVESPSTAEENVETVSQVEVSGTEAVSEIASGEAETNTPAPETADAPETVLEASPSESPEDRTTVETESTNTLDANFESTIDSGSTVESEPAAETESQATVESSTESETTVSTELESTVEPESLVPSEEPTETMESVEPTPSADSEPALESAESNSEASGLDSANEEVADTSVTNESDEQSSEAADSEPLTFFEDELGEESVDDFEMTLPSDSDSEKDSSESTDQPASEPIQNQDEQTPTV